MKTIEQLQTESDLLWKEYGALKKVSDAKGYEWQAVNRELDKAKLRAELAAEIEAEKEVKP